MNLDQVRYCFFIGIGGIGMSALARYFHAKNCTIAGYDKTPSPLTDQLEKEGMAIHFEDDVKNIPGWVYSAKEETLIIYTPAIPINHKQFNHLRDEGFELFKRSAVLGEISKNYFTVAVGGTHGKTTTSSMILHLLAACKVPVIGLVGGITANYNRNFLQANLDQEKEPVLIVEADEYDRSFLTLSPDIAVITNTDADHLDIYGTGDSLKEGFEAFAKLLPENGQLLLASDSEIKVKEKITKRYSLTKGHIYAENLRTKEHSFVFDFYGSLKIEGLKLFMPGTHNVENMLAAIEVVLSLGVKSEDLTKAVESFKGIRRRFEYIIQSEDRVFVDDYAHHPTEINALIESLRFLYPEKKLSLIFQPHLYSRTRDFADGFAASLSKADEVILLPIYPARELPIEGVESELILEKMSLKNAQILQKEALTEYVACAKPALLATVGAGDIDRLVQPIKEVLTKEVVH